MRWRICGALVHINTDMNGRVCGAWLLSTQTWMNVKAPSILLNYHVQGSPQEKFKAEQVGMVWAGVVTTSTVLVTTSEKYDYWRHGGRSAERAWGEHWCTVMSWSSIHSSCAEFRGVHVTTSYKCMQFMFLVSAHAGQNCKFMRMFTWDTMVHLGDCHVLILLPRKVSVLSNNSSNREGVQCSPPSLPSLLHLSPPPKRPLYNQSTMTQADFHELVQPQVVCFTCANLLLGYLRLCLVSAHLHKGVVSKVMLLIELKPMVLFYAWLLYWGAALEYRYMYCVIVPCPMWDYSLFFSS